MTPVGLPSKTNAITDFRAPTQRQPGFDIARALAIIGMVIVNFKIVVGAENTGPQWLAWLVGLLDGRAAATFVILAGIGMSLLSRRARLSGDGPALAANRTLLIKRAAFLFCFGLIYTPVWPADILHFYGIYLLIGAFMLTASDLKLWSTAAGFAVLFLDLLVFLDYDKGWDWNTLTYTDFWTFTGMVRHLFFNGFHPVLPWASFILVGIWLGRQDMTRPALRKRIMAGGLAAILLAETASHVLTRWMPAAFPNENPEDILALCDTAPIPPTPLYMLSAGGTALVVIVLCIAMAEKLQFTSFAWVLNPLVATGQLALTLYVAHVVIGMGFLEAIGRLNDMDLPLAVISAVCFFTFGMAFAMIWRRFFRRGPLEWAMRMVTG